MTFNQCTNKRLKISGRCDWPIVLQSAVNLRAGRSSCRLRMRDVYEQLNYGCEDVVGGVGYCGGAGRGDSC